MAAIYKWSGYALPNTEVPYALQTGYGDISTVRGGAIPNGSTGAMLNDLSVTTPTARTTKSVRFHDISILTNNNESYWTYTAGTYPVTGTPVTGAWSARWYYKQQNSTASITYPVIRFRSGTTRSLEVQSVEQSKPSLVYATGTITKPTSLSPASGLFRYELQVDPNRSPKVVLRVYTEDGTTPVWGATASPTGTTDWDNFQIGFYQNGDNVTDVYYSDIEIHNNYDLSGNLKPSVSTPSAASTGATGYPATNAIADEFHYSTTTNATTAQTTMVEGTDYIKTTNIKYVDGTAYGRYLDLYVPTGTPPINGWPVVVWTHGGYFIAGYKTDIPMAWVHDLLAAGFAVASVEYVKSGILGGHNYGDYFAPDYIGGRYPSHTIDFKRAGAYLRDHAVSLGIDGQRMFASGHSAGGFIALTALTTRGLSHDSAGRPVSLQSAATSGYAWADGYTGTDPVFLGAIIYNAPTDMDKARDWDPTYSGQPYTLRRGHAAFQNLLADGTLRPYVSGHSAASHIALNAANMRPVMYVEGAADFLAHYEHEDVLAEAMATYDATIPTPTTGAKYTNVVTPNNHHLGQAIYNRDTILGFIEPLYETSFATSQTTEPTEITATTDMQTPTTTGSGIVTPNAIVIDSQFPSPSISIGGAQTPAPWGGDTTVMTPSITGSGTTTPPIIVATTSVETPAVTGSAVYESTMTPDSIVADTTLPGVIIQTTTVTPTGSPVDDSFSDTYSDTYIDTFGVQTSGGGTGTFGDTYSDTYYGVYGQDGTSGGGGGGGGGTPTPVPGALGGDEIGPGAIWRTYLLMPREQAPYSELMAKARSITLSLGEPSVCSFSISGLDPAALTLDEMITDVVWNRNGTDIVRMRTGSSTDEIDADTHTVTFNGVDYRGLLDRRFLSTTISTTGSATGTDQADIIWQMITQTQTALGGNLGITKQPAWAVSGIRRKDVWDRGTAIGQAITEIGLRRSVDGLYGFDWDVLPDLSLHLYEPRRGTSTGFSIEYGINCKSVSRSISSDDYGNYAVTQWTDKLGNPKEGVAYSSDLGSRPEGRWEVWEGGTWATTGEGLAAAQGTLSVKQGMLPSYECVLKSGTWDPQYCFLGDTIPLTVVSGRLNVRAVPYRVQSIKIDISDDGEETVTVTLGSPPFKIASQLWIYGRSITALERR